MGVNLIALATLAALAWLLWQHRLARARGPFLPSDAGGPAWTARIAEASVLTAGAVPVMWLAASRGPIAWLGEVRPELARIHVAVFAAAVVLALCGVAGVLRGRTLAGAMILATAVCGYALAQESANSVLTALAPDGADKPVVRYMLHLESEVDGADLWVNGVNLGKMPVAMTLDEFYAKVPVWEEPPAGFADEAEQVMIPEPSLSEGRNTVIYKTWIRFEPPEIREGDGRVSRYEVRFSKTRYYARVRYGGQWGYGGGAAGGSGIGGGHAQDWETLFEVEFAVLKTRRAALMAKARLADYRGDAGIFAALETHGRQGWRAVREAAAAESEMMRLFDAWATWRYGLDKVKDARTAWAALERIRSEAEAKGEYDSRGIEGHAVEMLVPFLDQKQLVDEAMRFIPPARRYVYGYTRGNEFGQPYFAALRFRRPRELPMKLYPLAHAVWKMNEALTAGDGAPANLIQARLVPEMMRAWDGGLGPNDLAFHLGGPDVDRFLLRQNWFLPPDRRARWDDAMSIHGVDVNKWLYLLASLPGEAGREFRRVHRNQVTAMADRILWEDGSYRSSGLPDFLFLDLDLGQKSLAAEYWPEFRQRALRVPHDALEATWDYLTRMEPVSTVEMYVDAWRDFREDYSWRQGAMQRVLGRISEPKLEAVVQALKEEIEKTTDVSSEKWRGEVESWREFMLRELRHYESRGQETARVLAELAAGANAKRREQIADFLARARPNHALVKALAESGNPEWQLMVMGAVEASPTRDNRALLEMLCLSDDAAVRDAALATHERLRVLADTPAEAFAAMP